MVLNGTPGSDSRRELLTAWERECRASAVDATPCTGPDAQFLVSALSSALRRGSQTPELGRAARSWGARFSAPVEALATLAALREVVLEATHGSSGPGQAIELPVEAETVNRVMDQLMLEAVDSASANLRAQARTDPLTGCANRLALNEDLAHALNSAARSGLDLALAAVDLDGLKRINDTKGHAAGDEALKQIVERLKAELRDADTVYRTGGDEFVIVAPFTDTVGASSMLERASAADGPRFSWGVSSLRAVGDAAVDDPELLVIAADTDLYARRRRFRELELVPAAAERSAAAAAAAVLVAASAATKRRSRAAIATTAASVRGAASWLGSTARRDRVLIGSAAGSVLVGARRHRIGLASAALSIVLALAAVLGLSTAFHEGTTTAGRAPRGSLPNTTTPAQTTPAPTVPNSVPTPWRGSSGPPNSAGGPAPQSAGVPGGSGASVGTGAGAISRVAPGAGGSSGAGARPSAVLASKTFQPVTPSSAGQTSPFTAQLLATSIGAHGQGAGAARGRGKNSSTAFGPSPVHGHGAKASSPHGVKTNAAVAWSSSTTAGSAPGAPAVNAARPNNQTPASSSASSVGPAPGAAGGTGPGTGNGPQSAHAGASSNGASTPSGSSPGNSSFGHSKGKGN